MTILDLKALTPLMLGFSMWMSEEEKRGIKTSDLWMAMCLTFIVASHASKISATTIMAKLEAAWLLLEKEGVVPKSDDFPATLPEAKEVH